MDSPDLTESKINKFLPFIGALQMDLHRMLRSRVVQGWIILTGLIALGTVSEAAKQSLTAAQALKNLYSTYIIICSTAVIIVSAGAVSSESGVVADSILSRGITRYAYILSKYFSRLFTVLLVCLLITLPASYFASVHLEGPLALKSVMLAHAYILGNVIFLTILGVTFSIWFDRALVSIAALWVIYYFLGAIWNALDLGFMCPAALLRDLGSVLNGRPPNTPLWQVMLGFGIPALSVGVVGTAMFSRRDV